MHGVGAPRRPIRYDEAHEGSACAQVKETIMTSALLQLPLSMPRREKERRITAIIEQLVRGG